VGVLVVALLASGFAIYRWRSAQLQIEANSALALIQSKPVPPGDVAAGPGSEEYLEFASRYRGTAAGNRGLLLAAGALFREGKYAESLAQFEAFRAGNLADPMAGTGALGVAACLEAMGKNDEAIAAHRNVIATYPESAAATQSKLALGGLLELKGEAQEAFNLYEQLQTTALANEAQTRQQTLLASHPELAATNTAVPELSAPEVPVVEPEND
jgi:tetratricopeptide (TPR) repeat protein